MMNAEVTAENRPACRSRQHATAGTPCETHEYQSGIQILVMLLYELLVVLLSLLVVMREELSPVILLGGWYILFPVAWI